MVNPWRVLDRIQAGSIPDSTLDLMAAFLPLLTLLALVLVVVVVLFVFLAFSIEKKYVAAIERLLEQGDEKDSA